MNSTELGKKIREIRIAKHMTQNDVAGTFITRNMLSQIENGIAYPSIKTLEHIANVLDVSLEQLVSSDTLPETLTNHTDTQSLPVSGNPHTTDYLNILSSAKDMYKSKKYIEAVKLLADCTEKDSPVYDEVNALLAMSYYELARLSQKDSDTSSAIAYAHQVVEFSGIGIYASDELMMKAFKIIKNSDII